MSALTAIEWARAADATWKPTYEEAEMSALVLPDHSAVAKARFAPLQVDGEWTVWDVELERYIVHEAVWDARAADDVAEALGAHPAYVRIWNWAGEEGRS